MHVQTIEAAAPSLPVQLTVMHVSSAAEIERTIKSFAGKPNAGVIVLPSLLIRDEGEQIIALTNRHRMPAICSFHPFVTSGLLVSYSADWLDLYRRAASYVDRILKGEKPAGLPVQQPIKYELIINLKTAKAIGVEVPPTSARPRRRGDRVTPLRTRLETAVWTSVSTVQAYRAGSGCKLAMLVTLLGRGWSEVVRKDQWSTRQRSAKMRTTRRIKRAVCSASMPPYLVALVGGSLIVNAAIEMYYSYDESREALIAVQREKAQGAAAVIEQFVKEIEGPSRLGHGLPTRGQRPRATPLRLPSALAPGSSHHGSELSRQRWPGADQGVTPRHGYSWRAARTSAKSRSSPRPEPRSAT